MGYESPTWRLCQENDWHVGSVIAGTEGNAVATIEIMYLSRQTMLAKDLDTGRENMWTLEHRNWKDTSNGR